MAVRRIVFWKFESSQPSQTVQSLLAVSRRRKMRRIYRDSAAITAICRRTRSAASSALPGRSANHTAEIAAPEGRVLVLKHIGLYVAECGVGLVFDAVVECQDNVFLELLRARMRVHDRFSFPVAVFGIGQSQHIHLDAGRHQSD